MPASAPASVANCSVSATSPSSPNTLVLKCQPGWDGGLEQTFTLKVLEGKNNYSSNRGEDINGKPHQSVAFGRLEEWISSGSSLPLGKGAVPPARDAVPLQAGVLAVLAGQTVPHFTVSGLAAGREYLLRVILQPL